MVHKSQRLGLSLHLQIGPNALKRRILLRSLFLVIMPEQELSELLVSGPLLCRVHKR